jgi:hypothetical protein
MPWPCSSGVRFASSAPPPASAEPAVVRTDYRRHRSHWPSPHQLGRICHAGFGSAVRFQAVGEVRSPSSATRPARGAANSCPCRGGRTPRHLPDRRGHSAPPVSAATTSHSAARRPDPRSVGPSGRTVLSDEPSRERTTRSWCPHRRRSRRAPATRHSRSQPPTTAACASRRSGSLGGQFATYIESMTSERDELRRLVEDLPDEQVAAAIEDLRRRLTTSAAGRWPPPWFGGATSRQPDAAAAADDLLANGFGRSD